MALNGFSALLTREQAEELARQPGVLRVSHDGWRQKMTDASPGFLGVSGPGGAWSMGYDGEGVIVGVIDTGIWPEHPSLPMTAPTRIRPSPSTTVKDRLVTSATSLPTRTMRPSNCNNKLIGARQMLDTYRALVGADPDEFDSARDDEGHGTHTASTAAGNENVAAEALGISRGLVSGIAPRAHVMAYKGLGNLGGFTSDLAAAIDQAVADGVDVINYSLGSGTAGLTAEDDLAFLFAADAGVFVATSAGNNGPDPGTVGSPGSVPWLTTVGASTQPRSFDGTVTLGNGMSYTGTSFTGSLASAPLVDAAAAGNDLCLLGSLDATPVDGAIVLCRRGGPRPRRKEPRRLHDGRCGHDPV